MFVEATFWTKNSKDCCVNEIKTTLNDVLITSVENKTEF